MQNTLSVTQADQDSDLRARARRWLLFAAALWLSYPLLVAVVPDPFYAEWTTRQILMDFTWGVPMGILLLWAAHLSRDRRLWANILTRGIASSTLILVLMFAFAEQNSACVFSIVVAVAMGRTLQLLGERGLDGSEDHQTEFEPVRFRGVLILTLLLACTDAVTLLWTAVFGTVNFVAWYVINGKIEPWMWSTGPILLTLAVTVLMPVNVWGLLRLRTWALFSGMLTNVAIGILVVIDVLAVGDWTAVALVTTAAIQLLLALPILAAALGRGGSHQYSWVGPGLLRVVVPAAVLVTIGGAVAHLSWSVHW